MENFNFHQISPSAVFLINDLAGSIFFPFRRTALIPSLLFNAAPPLHRLIAQSLVNLFYVTGILYFAQLATFRLTRFQLLLKTPSHSRLLFILTFLRFHLLTLPPPAPSPCDEHLPSASHFSYPPSLSHIQSVRFSSTFVNSFQTIHPPASLIPLLPPQFSLFSHPAPLLLPAFLFFTRAPRRKRRTKTFNCSYQLWLKIKSVTLTTSKTRLKEFFFFPFSSALNQR